MEEGAIQFIRELYRSIDSVRRSLRFGGDALDNSFMLGCILDDMEKEYEEIL